MTRLAVAIFVTDPVAALAALARAKEAGADLVELRIDAYFDPCPAGEALIQRLAVLRDLISRAPLPVLVTCRPVWEGGRFDGDESVRIAILEHAGSATPPPALLDVELAAYQRSANLRQKVHLVVDHPGAVRPLTTQLVLSSHDFAGRPADLDARVQAMLDAPACRVAKIVWTAPPEGDLRDSLDALRFLQRSPKPMISLCMGASGLLTRMLAKKFGAHLTFCALDEQGGTAPGQPTLAQMKTLYRWDTLTADTPVYGVIGWPVAHSMSPAIHNAGFAAVGCPGVYLPMPIAPTWDAFRANLDALLAFPQLHFRGASVTIPHKEHLLRYVDERRRGDDTVEPLARVIGAANTLVVRPDGSLAISNTDYAAALDAVCHGMGIDHAGLNGLRVGVLGAGGAARAIVAGFAHHGATVVVYNRHLERAQALAQEFDGRTGKVVAAAWDKLCAACCQVMINCTPVGMHPHVDDSPISSCSRMTLASSGGTDIPPVDAARWLTPGGVVFDTIYNPPRTKLLEQAHAAGCITISGVEMFVRQAVGQFELWTGRPAPVDLFRQVILDRLTPSPLGKGPG